MSTPNNPYAHFVVQAMSDHADYERERLARVGGAASAMTMRDFFAGQALAGMVAADVENKHSCDAQAEHAYALADAMLKERSKDDA